MESETAQAVGLGPNPVCEPVPARPQQEADKENRVENRFGVRSKIEGYMHETVATEHRVEQAKAEARDYQSQLELAKAEVREHQSRACALKVRVNELERLAAGLQEQNTSLASEVAGLRHECQRYEAVVEGLQERLRAHAVQSEQPQPPDSEEERHCSPRGAALCQLCQKPIETIEAVEAFERHSESIRTAASELDVSTVQLPQEAGEAARAEASALALAPSPSSELPPPPSPPLGSSLVLVSPAADRASARLAHLPTTPPVVEVRPSPLDVTSPSGGNSPQLPSQRDLQSGSSFNNTSVFSPLNSASSTPSNAFLSSHNRTFSLISTLDDDEHSGLLNIPEMNPSSGGAYEEEEPAAEVAIRIASASAVSCSPIAVASCDGTEARSPWGGADHRVSAVRIQSVYRGHLDRVATREERRLSGLPIHAPSSPSHAASRAAAVASSMGAKLIVHSPFGISRHDRHLMELAEQGRAAVDAHTPGEDREREPRSHGRQRSRAWGFEFSPLLTSPAHVAFRTSDVREASPLSTSMIRSAGSGGRGPEEEQADYDGKRSDPPVVRWTTHFEASAEVEMDPELPPSDSDLASSPLPVPNAAISESSASSRNTTDSLSSLVTSSPSCEDEELADTEMLATNRVRASVEDALALGRSESINLLTRPLHRSTASRSSEASAESEMGWPSLRSEVQVYVNEEDEQDQDSDREQQQQLERKDSDGCDASDAEVETEVDPDLDDAALSASARPHAGSSPRVTPFRKRSATLMDFSSTFSAAPNVSSKCARTPQRTISSPSALPLSSFSVGSFAVTSSSKPPALAAAYAAKTRTAAPAHSTVAVPQTALKEAERDVLCTKTSRLATENHREGTGTGVLAPLCSVAPSATVSWIADNPTVVSEIRDQMKVLKNIESNWSLRVKAMNKLETLFREKNAHRMAGAMAELMLIRKCIATQLEDLRSSIVREACRLLIGMADVMGDSEEFADLLSFMLPVLFKRLYVTIKCISEGSHDCIMELLARSRTLKAIPKILVGANDNHAIVRRRCSEYLCEILQISLTKPLPQQLSFTAGLSPLLEKIQAMTIKGLNDSDRDVRSSTRQLFLTLERVFPEMAKELFGELSAATQKAIQADARM